MLLAMSVSSGYAAETVMYRKRAHLKSDLSERRAAPAPALLPSPRSYATILRARL